MQKSPRIDWVDVARWSSILLVVLYHTDIWLDSYNIISASFGQFDRAFRPIRMPLFFAISGYLAGSSIRKGRRYILSQKVLPLIYLYGIWNLIQWLLFRFTGINNKALEIGEDVLQLVSVWYAPTTGLWFLWALSIYWIVGLCVRPRYSAIILFAASGISVAFMSRLVIAPNFAQMFVLWYSPFFFGGMYYGSIAAARMMQNTRQTIIVALITFAGATIVVNTVSSGISVGLSRLIQSTCGLVAGCSASIIASRIGPARVVLIYIGRNTLPIFLTHEIIVEICALVIVKYNFSGGLFYFYGPPLLAIGAVAVSLMLYRVSYFMGYGFLYQIPNWLQLGFSRAISRYAVRA